MAFQITINFANDDLNAESREAFADAYQWQGSQDPRGGTRAAFRDFCIKQYVKDIVKSKRIRDAHQAAIASVPDVQD